MLYFYSLSGDTSIIDLNEFMFIQQLDTYMYRSEIRNKRIYQSNTKAKEASTDPLESEKK